MTTTDPNGRLFRKGPGKEARLRFMGHTLMENRNGLIVGLVATRASGHAERLAALTLIEPHADRPQPITLGAGKGYCAGEFVMELREKAVTPHVAQNTSGRRSAIKGHYPSSLAMLSPSAFANARKTLSTTAAPGRGSAPR